MGTGDIPKKINPMIDGLTTGKEAYDGIFILRNPENCNLMDYSLKEIPIYLEKKLKSNYEICTDFLDLKQEHKIVGMIAGEPMRIKDFEVTSFVVDTSNHNTHIIRFRDKERKNFSCFW